MTYVAGIDVGSQSVKGVLLDAEGHQCGSAAHALSMTHPRGGWAEQDPGDLDEGVAAVLRTMLASAGARARDVRALCLACQVDGVVPVSATGDALGPAIIWLDRRADTQARYMADTVGADRLFEMTGLVADASHSGPKILWIHDNDPDTFAAAAAFPPVAGYLLQRLTGRLAIDHANASSSMLYDLRSRRWSGELLGAFGLNEDHLGEVLAAGDVAGTLTRQASEATGLSPTCEVLVGTGDEHAASIGAGAVTAGIITDVTGTAEPVTVASPTLVLDFDGLVETHAHALPDHYLVENPGFVSGGSTKWLADHVLGVDQSAVFELAAGAPPGADGVIFLPALSGAMAPRWNARMRGAFAGLAMSHTSHTLARAVLEGCAFALRDITDRFAALGLGHDEIRVVGGGAASDTWMQIKADVTGRPVRRVLVNEATALGAALLAGVTRGTFTDLVAAADRTVAVAPEPFLADPNIAPMYDEAYRHYRALYDGVEGALT
ncbi:MAG: FGGY-family carbohydrate kinase [Acidimicrobiales bacterium]